MTELATTSAYAFPSPEEPQLRIEFAGAAQYEELRQFRASVFRDELGIQHPDYQDVFNDYVSKNVVLRRGPSLDGAVRLAYSREADSFFISYFCVRRAHRSRALSALLLGAIFHLMRTNGIGSISGHAGDENLQMYLGAGCTVAGARMRKYGFACDWTPIRYVMGTNPAQEERLIERVGPYLGAEQSRWEFTPSVAMCGSLRELDDVTRRLVSTRQIFGIIPHLGTTAHAGDAPCVRGLDFVRASDLDGGDGPEFEHYNERFDRSRVIVASPGSPFVPLARVYGLLHGRRVVITGDWAGIDASNVMLLSGDGAAPPDNGRTARRFTAESPAMMSSLLLRDYLQGLGPAPEPVRH